MNKLLFIIPLPPPVHGSSMIGASIKNSNLINNKFDIDYINLTTSYSIDEIGTYNLIKVNRFLKIFFHVLVKIIKNKYDLCYVSIAIHGKAFYRDLFIVFLLRLFQRKIVFHLHNKGASNFKNIFRKVGYRFVFKNAFVILLSNLLYFDIQDYVNKEKVYICPNGISNINYSCTKKKSTDNTVNLLFLSNMMLSKGVFALLDTCTILVKKQKKFICHFIGGWKDISEKDFFDYIIKNKLDNNIRYHGPIYGEDKIEFLEMSDIFIHPTFEDCFPLNLLEAIQNGIPVVATKEGGIPDIVIDGENGLLCNKNDSQELAEKISLMIDNPQERINMGIAGKKHFERNFTINHFEEKMINILETIINE